MEVLDAYESTQVGGGILSLLIGWEACAALFSAFATGAAAGFYVGMEAWQQPATSCGPNDPIPG